jgi:hypothetical protein
MEQTNKNPEEYRLVSQYIITYEFTAIEFALREAVKYNIRKLAYIEAIWKRYKERIAIEKGKEVSYIPLSCFRNGCINSYLS